MTEMPRVNCYVSAITPGGHMHCAEVEFTRSAGIVVMTLMVNRNAVLVSSSHESIVRELQLREVRHLTIDGKFSTELPTIGVSVSIAAEVEFSEPWAALRLVAACTSFGESHAFPFPERRLKKRTEIGMLGRSS